MYSFIERWYDKVKPYLFNYKNGFFVLPYINNSPQMMWESLQKMPFIKFDRSLNRSESDTPFLFAKMYYQDLEKELVIFYNTINYKKNVHYNHYLKKEFPVEYYCLTGFLSKTDDNTSKTIINDVHFNGQLWILHKPGATIKDYHFKDSQTETVNIYFTDRWLNEYILLYTEGNEKLEQFIASANTSVGYASKDSEIGIGLLQQIDAAMKQEVSEERTYLLKEHVHHVIHFFKTDCLQEVVSEKYLKLSNADRLKLIEVEQLLAKNIYNKFPGIDAIAQQIGFSETKLKALFKEVYEATLLDYFQHLQMKTAKQFLLQDKLKVADVATMFGYQNASKFAATFKHKMDQFPSEINKTGV